MKKEIRADKKNLSIDGDKRRHFDTHKIKFRAVNLSFVKDEDTCGEKITGNDCRTIIYE